MQSMHAVAVLALVVASVSASRIKPRQNRIQPVPTNQTSVLMLKSDFVCPVEYCYTCCGPDKGAYGSHFKCILRDRNKLPVGRECFEAKQRTNDATQFKTECLVLTGESNPPTKRCYSESAFGKFRKWAWDKKGEVFGGLAKKTVMEMGFIIKLIHKRVGQKCKKPELKLNPDCKRAKRVTRLLPLSALVPIHPVDVMNAIKKTAKRARAAVKARRLLEGDGAVLTQKMINGEPSLKDFKSINAFYVVDLGPEEGFVTFEGNGRSVALRWAFRNQKFRENLKVEVEEFVFETEEDRKEIVDRIKKLRRKMGSEEFDEMAPPALDDASITKWGKAVPKMLKQRIKDRDMVISKPIKEEENEEDLGTLLSSLHEDNEEKDTSEMQDTSEMENEMQDTSEMENEETEVPENHTSVLMLKSDFGRRFEDDLETDSADEERQTNPAAKKNRTKSQPWRAMKGKTWNCDCGGVFDFEKVGEEWRAKSINNIVQGLQKEFPPKAVFNSSKACTESCWPLCRGTFGLKYDRARCVGLHEFNCLVQGPDGDFSGDTHSPLMVRQGSDLGYFKNPPWRATTREPNDYRGIFYPTFPFKDTQVIVLMGGRSEEAAEKACDKAFRNKIVDDGQKRFIKTAPLWNGKAFEPQKDYDKLKIVKAYAWDK